MAQINLLPWREELRQRRRKDFGIMAVVAAALGGAVFLGVYLQIEAMTEAQDKRNKFLETEISKLDKKIAEIQELDEEKQRLINRMNAIQALQADRPEIVHLFDELVGTLPEGAYYTKVTQQGRQLTIQGVAQSNARVSSLMRNVDGSQWMANPGLIEIKAQTGTGPSEQFRLSSFSLKVGQMNPNRPKDEEEEDAPKKSSSKTKKKK